MFAGEDWDLTIRCKAVGAHLVVCKSPIIHYEQAKSLRNLIRKDNYYIKNIHLFAEKHPKVFTMYLLLVVNGKYRP